MKYIKINEIDKYKDALLIDVRMPSEYIINHLNNFINIPVNSILTIVGKYPKNKNIILYCKEGVRSRRAALMLNDLGYNNTYIILK